MYYTNRTVVPITVINRFQIGILYEKGNKLLYKICQIVSCDRKAINYQKFMNIFKKLYHILFV